MCAGYFHMTKERRVQGLRKAGSGGGVS